MCPPSLMNVEEWLICMCMATPVINISSAKIMRIKQLEKLYKAWNLLLLVMLPNTTTKVTFETTFLTNCNEWLNDITPTAVLCHWKAECPMCQVVGRAVSKVSCLVDNCYKCYPWRHVWLVSHIWYPLPSICRAVILVNYTYVSMTSAIMYQTEASSSSQTICFYIAWASRPITPQGNHM